MFLKVLSPDTKTKSIAAIQRVLYLIAVLLDTALFIPVAHSFVWVLACKSEDELYAGLKCYSGTFYIHFAFALVSLVEFVFIGLFLTLLMVEYNPYSKLPFAAPLSKVKLYANLVKLMPVLILTLDQNVSARGLTLSFFKYFFFSKLERLRHSLHVLPRRLDDNQAGLQV